MRSHGLRMVAIIVAASFATGYCRADEHSHAGHTHAKSGRHAGHSHDGQHLCEEDIKMPEDYASAVTRIKECRATIGEEIAEGHWDEVHAPLDEATIILNKLMPLARSSGVPKAKWQDLNLAAKDLKKRLGGLHAALHKSGKVDFKQYAKPIDEAIARLDAFVSNAPSTAAKTATPKR